MRWQVARLRAVAATRKGRVSLVALAVIVAATGLGTALWLPSRHSHDSLANTPPAIPMLASIGFVGPPSNALPAGAPLRVTAHALGAAPIAALELWDGESRFAVAKTANSAPAFSTQWQWSSPAVGEHVLVVRVVDVIGRVVQSGVLRIDVTATSAAPAAATRRAVAAPAAFSSKSDAAAAYAIEPPNLGVQVTGCGATLKVGAASGADGFSLLGLAPNGDMFTPIGSFTPHRGKATLEVPLPPGVSVFTVAAFDSTAQTYSAPVLAHASDACTAGKWSGSVRLDGGKLRRSPDIGPAVDPNVDRAYLYLRRPGQAALRVPGVPNAFVVKNAKGEFDFTPYLPAAGPTWDVEAWGWKSGKLLNLGSGHYASAGGSATKGVNTSGLGAAWFADAAATGVGTTGLDIVREKHVVDAPTVEELVDVDQVVRPDPKDTRPLLEKFRWNTLLPVSNVVVQVLPYSPAATPDLAPPFLIDQQTLTLNNPATSGDFSLDVRPYLFPKHDVPSMSDSERFQQQLGPLWAGQTSPTTSSPATSSPGVPRANAYQPVVGGNATIGGGGTTSQGVTLATVGDGIFPLGFDGTFYIRVIPITPHGPASPSPAVIVEMVDPPAAPTFDFSDNTGAYTVDFAFTAPQGPDRNFVRCAIVKDILPGYFRPLGGIDYAHYLQTGEPLCYHPPDDSWSFTDAFDAFVAFVSSVWNFVSGAYSWVKQQVVSLVLAATPCKLIASDSVCETLATAAIDGVLASFGIPPSLPDFDAVVAATKGDLAGFVVRAASSIPGVADACGLADTASAVTSKVKNCTDVAGEAIDAVVAQVKQARGDAAAQASGYGWPGVVLAPDPRGEFQPASVTYTVTRTDKPLVPGAPCFVDAHISSLVHDKAWWPELKNGHLTSGSGDISGEPFQGVSAPIPPLRPGESVSRQMWFTNVAYWWPSPASHDYWRNYMGYDAKDGNQAAQLLAQGAELTFSVAARSTLGNCSATVQKKTVLSGPGYY